MKKILVCTLVAFISLSMGVGMITQSVNAFWPVDASSYDGVIINDNQEEPYENPGRVLVDVTDLLPNDHTASAYKDFIKDNIYVIRERTSNSIINSGFRFKDDQKSTRMPLVTLVANGKPLNTSIAGVDTGSYGALSVNQTIPPSGIIEWDFTAGESCSNGSPTHADPMWDCSAEMPNITFFVEGGGNGITVGMKDCITDVFGAALNPDLRIKFVRDNTMPVGAAAYYTTSLPDPNNPTGWLGMITMPSGYGAAPQVRPSWYDGAGNPIGVWQTSARNGRLDTLTHEMVHAHYDQLNPYYHPWGEGMVEMQAILARKLWCQRNGYDPSDIANYDAQWPTNPEKMLARRPNLAWGVPVVLPIYENINQPGIQASGGFFYTSAPNLRSNELSWTRYQTSATCWWKVWRETSPAIIDSGNPATYGTDTYFVDWNSEYYDWWFMNGPGWGVVQTGFNDNTAQFHQFTQNVLFNDIDMGGESDVEGQDYQTTWSRNQFILDTSTNAGYHVFIPAGPSSPDGGRPYDYSMQTEYICDIGAYYSDADMGTYMPAYPFFYETIAGGPNSGQEIGRAGDIHIQVTVIDNSADETTDVEYHPTWDGVADPPWTNLPAFGNNIPNLTFGATGMLTTYEAGETYPAGLSFENLGSADPVGWDAGGMKIDFSVDANSDPTDYEASQTIYYASAESIGGGVHTVITVGDGENNTNDDMFITYDGGPEIDISAINDISNPGNADSAYFHNYNFTPPGSTTYSSHQIGYRFDGNNLEFDSYSYANTGPFFYHHIHAPAVQRLTQDLPMYTGRIGHAILVQSTRYNSPNDPEAAANKHYYCRFCTDITEPESDALPDKEARPDYIPEGSSIIAAYLYTNEAGRQVAGQWQQEPILVNPGEATNPAPYEYCIGDYIGSNEGYVPAAPATCRSGGGNPVNMFRFDITKYLIDPYDTIHVTNVYQVPAAAGTANLYGFTILLIFENEDLPLSMIKIADGAYDVGRPTGNHVVTTFNGFRTPPNVSEWEADNSGGKAYITQVCLSTDNNPCGSLYTMPGTGRWEPEWEFYAVGSDKLPQGDRIWPSPLPAPQGAWWAPYYKDPNNVGDRAHWDAEPSYVPSVLPPKFPADYRFSPRASDPDWYSVGKQSASSWYWNRPFSNSANKTALAWEEDTYWDDICHMDYDPNPANHPTGISNTDNQISPSGWIIEQREPGVDPTYSLANPNYAADPSVFVPNSYLAGNDTEIWYRPYAVCNNSEIGTDAEWDFSDGLGPCVPTEIPNLNPWPSSCDFDHPANSSNSRTCDSNSNWNPWPGAKYPTTEEEGAAHTVNVLQVPIIPSLSLEKTAYPSDTVLPGSVITYSLTITNDTPFTQQGVMLTENYPVGVTYLDANPPPDIGDNVWTTSISDDGEMAPWESFTVVIRVNVGYLDKGTRLVNVASASAETAPQPVSDQHINVCLGEPDLIISKTSKQFLAVQGDKITYHIKIKNVGDREAEGVVLTDIFPREFEYVGSVPAGSQGLSKITWAIGRLNAGETRYYELILKLRDDIRINPGVSVVNRAIVVSEEGLKAEDQAVLIVYRRPDQPVTCPKPDIDVDIEGKELTISVDKFGGCSPYTLRITCPDKGLDILATIDEVDKDKVVDLGVDLDDGDIIQIELRNKYDGSFYYCFKVDNGKISGEIPCP